MTNGYLRTIQCAYFLLKYKLVIAQDMCVLPFCQQIYCYNTKSIGANGS